MSDHLAHDGHYTELALERLSAGELSAADMGPHWAECADCRGRLEAMAQFDASLPRPRRRSRAPWIGGALAIAAAIVLVWVVPGARDLAPDAGIRIKGGFSFEVFVHDGSADRRALDGEVVHPGDRLGFRVAANPPGELLIAGIDAAGKVYPCYPQGTGGRSKRHGPTHTPKDLRQAMRLDATLGPERIVALLCEAPFTLLEVTPELKTGRAPAHCRMRQIRFDKRPR